MSNNRSKSVNMNLGRQQLEKHQKCNKKAKNTMNIQTYSSLIQNNNMLLIKWLNINLCHLLDLFTTKEMFLFIRIEKYTLNHSTDFILSSNNNVSFMIFRLEMRSEWEVCLFLSLKDNFLMFFMILSQLSQE